MGESRSIYGPIVFVLESEGLRVCGGDGWWRGGEEWFVCVDRDGMGWEGFDSPQTQRDFFGEGGVRWRNAGHLLCVENRKKCKMSHIQVNLTFFAKQREWRENSGRCMGVGRVLVYGGTGTICGAKRSLASVESLLRSIIVFCSLFNLVAPAESGIVQSLSRPFS